MQYAITYRLKIGDHTLAELDGEATIEPAGDGWQIGAIAFDGVCEGGWSFVAVPRNCELYKACALQIYSNPDTCGDITECWANFMAEQVAA